MSYYKIDNLEQYSNIITNLFVNPENFGVRLLKRILLGISNGIKSLILYGHDINGLPKQK
jgi:hypothetical protein